MAYMNYPTGKYYKCFILFYSHILMKILRYILQALNTYVR